jgi:hypothetical protein
MRDKHDDYDESDERPPLLPPWFAQRMIDDVWYFGLLLVTGHTLAISCIDKIWQDASGNVWLDVTMLERDDRLRRCFPDLEILDSPTKRQIATVNASHVVAAFELADT